MTEGALPPDERDPAESDGEDAMAYARFLEATPPGQYVEVSDYWVARGPSNYPYTAAPTIQLHCPSETCNGPRLFDQVAGGEHAALGDRKTRIVEYRCRNCNKALKVFALIGVSMPARRGGVYKLGEFPPFGPPVPTRAIKLVGTDRELFLQGRRAENQGLGIGAFAYYRRVVEDQKNRLFDEIIKVAERIGSAPAVIDGLRSARSETQFSRAVDEAKDLIPAVLLIDGHNPLTLLHRALSFSIHEHTDAECLAAAEAIRVVLYELAERIGAALKDTAELKRALHQLMHPPPRAEDPS
jgi:hypothetical protein